MNFLSRSLLILLSFAAAAGVAMAQNAPPAQPMSFFVTSVGVGKGADLGGLAGADAHCQKLAEAAGSTGMTWRAYLSTQVSGNQPPVNARDRIGKGPWYNAKGEMIAKDVADLHGDVERDRNNITKATALTEKGEVSNGRGDNPNKHDMLTGSTSTGRAFADSADHTCKNWTGSGDGSAMLGHHDRNGGGNTSWNSAHPSRGCSQENLVATGGAGLFYCFAAQ